MAEKARRRTAPLSVLMAVVLAASMLGVPAGARAEAQVVAAQAVAESCSVELVQPEGGSFVIEDSFNQRTSGSVSSTDQIRVVITSPEGQNASGVQASSDNGQTWNEITAQLGLTRISGSDIPKSYALLQGSDLVETGASVMLRAVFAPWAKVCVSEGLENGVVSVDKSTGNQGVDVGLHVVPEDGYRASGVSYAVDGGEPTSIAPSTSFSFPITGDVVVSATFVPEDQTDIEIPDAASLRTFAAGAEAGRDYRYQLIRLTSDIDLGGVTWETPFTTKTPFRGIFDGAGHRISGLAMSAEGSSISFFGTLANATVRDLSLAGTLHATEDESSPLTGAGFANDAPGSSFIKCSNEVDIDVAGQYAAGICAKDGDYEDCANMAHVSAHLERGDDDARGIAAGISGSSGGRFSRCANYGTISGATVSAGVLALSEGAEVSRCTNKGNISALGSWEGVAGGIVGMTTSQRNVTVTDCYNTGDITAEATSTHVDSEPVAAGILAAEACNNRAGSAPSTIKRCYSTGKLFKMGEANYPEANIGDVFPARLLEGSNFAGVEVVDPPEGLVSIDNCYGAADIVGKSAADLGDAWKDDSGNVNDGAPLLQWEDGESRLRALSFSVTGADAWSVRVWPDSDAGAAFEGSGAFALEPGTYSYVVSAEGCVPVSGVVRVTPYLDVNVTVQLKQAATVHVNAKPLGATVCVRGSDGALAPASGDGWLVAAGESWSWEATAEGCIGSGGVMAAAADGDAAAVSLLPKTASTPAPSVITKAGIYSLDDAPSSITIATLKPVTLEGAGVWWDASGSMRCPAYGVSMRSPLAGINLTLKDCHISNLSATVPTVDFAGQHNELAAEGEVVLDHLYGGDYGTSKAAVHVGQGSSLTVSGSGTMYLYKYSGGAGFGGNSGELNGDVTFNMTGKLFAKGSKQGALIGCGTNPGDETPGAISFLSGSYNLITNSRGAAIGGSAGSEGAAPGTEVSIAPAANVNVNVDYSGSAVGGGGYNGGNDASGGTLTYKGGSLRVYVDKNAAKNTSGWQGMPVAEGLNDAAVTALRLGEDGLPVYRCVVDTSGVSAVDGNYSAELDGERTIYEGPLHSWGYVQELLDKETGEQVKISSTPSNWYPIEDSNLYLYLAAGDRYLEVNGVPRWAKWNASAQSFTVTAAKPAGWAGYEPASAGGEQKDDSGAETGSNTGKGGDNKGTGGSTAKDGSTTPGDKGMQTPAPEPEGLAVGETATAGTGASACKVRAVSASEVAYTGPASDKTKKVAVPATVTVNGKAYEVTSIAKGAFSKSKATKVTVGANVAKIAAAAFKGAKYLKTVTVGNSVVSIGKQAFQNCKKLKTVTIGKSARTIGKNAFKGCKKLAKVTVKSSKLTKASFRNMVKGSKIKTVKLKGVSKKAKKSYRKWAKAYKVKVK